MHGAGLQRQAVDHVSVHAREGRGNPMSVRPWEEGCGSDAWCLMPAGQKALPVHV
jgi:hypothetical protein